MKGHDRNEQNEICVQQQRKRQKKLKSEATAASKRN